MSDHSDSCELLLDHTESNVVSLSANILVKSSIGQRTQKSLYKTHEFGENIYSYPSYALTLSIDPLQD